MRTGTGEGGEVCCACKNDAPAVVFSDVRRSPEDVTRARAVYPTAVSINSLVPTSSRRCVCVCMCVGPMETSTTGGVARATA